MNSVYCCPACKTNRSRFNLIEQVVHPIRKDPSTGKMIEHVPLSDPLQFQYQGEPYRVQCGICGLIDDERTFVAFGKQDSFQD
ncbi:hypothetical protein SAMN05444392_103230 [Seinonella peptonophila]|uniref:Uncharacterized protein n=1 Tax=Seinonella peptonophila TaxID=112248 RepID=A0A1M4WI41_9BACL|nr:DNA alkylation repair protein [Seinonella peptonophila]SHE80847.1 hypothetical protein SAMN05444392_103230 [Seinonella peptonophila]